MQEAENFLDQIPHSKALGMTLVSLEDDVGELRIDCASHLVGDPDTGVIHGGAITALLDNTAGMIARPPDVPREKIAIATLDLRIDYMGPADPSLPVTARARCFKRTSDVAFVRAIAYQSDPEDPVATCTATFMLGTRQS